jgi:hypothetical protein
LAWNFFQRTKKILIQADYADFFLTRQRRLKVLFFLLKLLATISTQFARDERSSISCWTPGPS